MIGGVRTRSAVVAMLALSAVALLAPGASRANDRTYTPAAVSSFLFRHSGIQVYASGVGTKTTLLNWGPNGAAMSNAQKAAWHRMADPRVYVYDAPSNFSLPGEISDGRWHWHYTDDEGAVGKGPQWVVAIRYAPNVWVAWTIPGRDRHLPVGVFRFDAIMRALR